MTTRRARLLHSPDHTNREIFPMRLQFHFRYTLAAPVDTLSPPWSLLQLAALPWRRRRWPYGVGNGVFWLVVSMPTWGQLLLVGREAGVTACVPLTPRGGSVTLVRVSRCPRGALVVLVEALLKRAGVLQLRFVPTARPPLYHRGPWVLCGEVGGGFLSFPWQSPFSPQRYHAKLPGGWRPYRSHRRQGRKTGQVRDWQDSQVGRIPMPDTCPRWRKR